MIDPVAPKSLSDAVMSTLSAFTASPPASAVDVAIVAEPGTLITSDTVEKAVRERATTYFPPLETSGLSVQFKGIDKSEVRFVVGGCWKK